MDIFISKSKLRLWLFGSMALVSLAGVAVEVLRSLYDLPSKRGAVPLLSLSYEENIPTFYSAVILLAAALLLALIALGTKRNGERFVAAWWVLSVGFFYIAVDEVLELHEQLTPLMSTLKQFGGVLTFSWVIPAAVLVLVLGLLFIPFLRHLPRATRNRFLLAGALYVGGAVVLELPLGAWTQKHGDENLGYALIDAVEESLEMLGVNLFLLGLVDYLSQKGWAVRFASSAAIAADPLPAP
jgi:hypothetical protein